MSRIIIALLLLTLCCCVIHCQNVPLIEWKDVVINDYVQNSPKYYQANVGSILNACTQVRFVLKVNSGSAVNVAIKKGAIATFTDYDYKVQEVQDGISYAYRGITPNSQIYVIVNGARSAWNLYSLNFECF